MRIRKAILGFILLVMTTGFAYGQDQEENSVEEKAWKQKLYFGGHASLQYGRFNDVFEVSPTLGYFINPQWVAGFGMVYSYYGYAMESSTGILTSEEHYTGVSLFSRYYFTSEKHPLLNHLYAHAEYEFLKANIIGTEANNSTTYLYSYQTPMIGLGYKQNLGKKTALNFTLGLAIGDKTKLPYRNPVIRIGLEF
jgi:hypothetical protein